MDKNKLQNYKVYWKLVVIFGLQGTNFNTMNEHLMILYFSSNSLILDKD